ncbi:MAG TPA: hypothetical protein VND98_08115 [Solirubrobacterales bacterium]|nr:hypothetical protein [Solirubrobacterales bacterium]
MSTTNVQLARSGYEAAARGDLEALEEFLDPEDKWHGGDPAAPGPCRNSAEVVPNSRFSAPFGLPSAGKNP